MPRKARGSVYKTKGGVGIRWVESGKRQHRSGFRNKTEATDWWDQRIAPKLKRGGPSAETTFEEFCVEYLYRWEPGVAARTVQSMKERLAPAREHFGSWRLRELEGAADDVARWRRGLPSEHARYKSTRALRQVLNAAVRWDYIDRNPALDFGENSEPRAAEIHPFSRDELDRIVSELRARDAAIVIFASETGLRTNEWIALEQQDVRRREREVVVRQRVTDGDRYVVPKNGSKRRVPLTPRALEALDMLPASIPLVFPASGGGYVNLNNWRNRVWWPALQAAGVDRRGPYALRHTFASEALHRGVSVHELARVMGASIQMIERHYGHLVSGSLDRIRLLLSEETG